MRLDAAQNVRQTGGGLWILMALAIALLGCGPKLTGTYRADVEQVGPPKYNHPGYSLAEVRARLAAEPEQLQLRRNGRFVLQRAGKTVWEGNWRVEADRLYLRATVVNGIAVSPALQDDKPYRVRGDTLIDEGIYSAYGLHLVFRKP
jgi:hypothetical protein